MSTLVEVPCDCDEVVGELKSNVPHEKIKILNAICYTSRVEVEAVEQESFRCASRRHLGVNHGHEVPFTPTLWVNGLDLTGFRLSDHQHDAL